MCRISLWPFMVIMLRLPIFSSTSTAGKEAVKMIKWQISPSLSHFLSHLPFPAEFCHGLALAITIDKCSHLSWQIYIVGSLMASIG